MPPTDLPTATEAPVLDGPASPLPVWVDPEVTALEAVLAPAEQMTVCAMLAQFKTTREILGALAKGGNTRATAMTVNRYRHAPKWQGLIERLREEYRTRILDVAIANARVRLDALQDQFDQIAKTRPQSDRSAATHRAEMRAILEQAQGEMHDQRSAAAVLMTQVMALSDEELERKRQQVVERIQRYGGRTHALRSQEPPTGAGSSHPATEDPSSSDGVASGGASGSGGGLHQRPDGTGHPAPPASLGPA